MIHQFSYVAPKDLNELLSLLDSGEMGIRLLAGGTDLLVNIRNGLAKPTTVVDVKRIEGASSIEYHSETGLKIGWATTINDILKHPDVGAQYPLLQTCAHDLASYQVRNRATVVGNIVNASPCSDMAPALLCLNGTIEVSSAHGKRSIPVGEFFTGVKRTVLRQNEMVTAITIPVESSGGIGKYRKLKRIQGHDLGIIGVAVAVVDDVMRIAVSSAAPTPVATGDLPLDIPDAEVFKIVDAMIKPISDVRCSAEYRRFMVGEFTRRLLGEVRS